MVNEYYEYKVPNSKDEVVCEIKVCTDDSIKSYEDANCSMVVREKLMSEMTAPMLAHKIMMYLTERPEVADDIIKIAFPYHNGCLLTIKFLGPAVLSAEDERRLEKMIAIAIVDLIYTARVLIPMRIKYNKLRASYMSKLQQIYAYYGDEVRAEKVAEETDGYQV